MSDFYFQSLLTINIIITTNINPIENLQTIIKRNEYENGKQYSSQDDLCDAIKTAVVKLKVKTIEKLNKIQYTVFI